MKKLILIMFAFVIFASCAFAAFDSSQNLSVDSIVFIVDGKSETLSHSGDAISKVAKPQDNVQVRVSVENKYKSSQEITIHDVEVEIIITGIDQDEEDIDLLSDAFDLDYEGNDRTHTFEFNFSIPPAAKDGTYDVEIIINGDDKHLSYDIRGTTTLKVERESHALVIKNFALTPAVLTCTSSTEIGFDIVNAGANNEDYVRYIIKNSALGINIDKNMIEMSSDPDEDSNTYKAIIPLKLTNPAPGTYPIIIEVYRDLSILEDATGQNLIVKECGTTTPPVIKPTPTPTPTPVQNEEEEEVQNTNNVPSSTPTPSASRVTPKTQPVIMGIPAGDFNSFTDSDAYIILLLMAVLIVIALIVLLLLSYTKK